MKKAFRLLIVNVLVLLSGCVILELLFGGWFADQDPMLNFSRPRNVAWSFRVPWQPEGTLYRRDRFGLRGLDAGLEDIFILTVGGSTTDQRYLSNADTWQERLQAGLERDGGKFDVVNAGLDGQSTVGHIKNFSQWFNKIETLRPRFVLFYIGVNDFYIGEENVWDASLEKNRGLKAFLDRSALVAAGRILREVLRSEARDKVVDQAPGHSFQGIDTSAYVTKRALAECCEEPYLVASMQGLRDRVKVLANLTEALGATPVFVNQRSALWERRDGVVSGAPVLLYAHPSTLKNLGEITGVDRFDIESFQAETILSACREAGAVCIDLFNEIHFDLESDFYDSVHNTPKGAEAIGHYLFEKLKDLRPRSRASVLRFPA